MRKPKQRTTKKKAAQNRVLTHFALKWGDEEEEQPTAVIIGFRDGETVMMAFPDECIAEEDETVELSRVLKGVKAARTVITPSDGSSEDWYRDWLLPDPTLLDSRVEAQGSQDTDEPVVELKVDLGDSTTDDTLEKGSELKAEDLSGAHTSEVGKATKEVKRTTGGSRKKAKRKKLREGSGCKQPDAVVGYETGRLLCITKNHRASGPKSWGRCEYRVRCNPDGSYTLEYFAGNRDDLKKGTSWPTVSKMFFALLALPPGTRHHRMTLKRFFNL